MLSHHVPDLVAIQLLTAVDELGSLSSAAQRLGMSQQAVSMRMRSLELQVGVILLQRTPRGTTLTEAGAIVLGWSTEVLAAAERLDAGIASIRSEALRQLDIAASRTVAEHLVPRWLLALRGRQEAAGQVATQIGLTVVNSEAVIELVRSGSMPLGFIETPALPNDLRVQLIGFDELKVAVAPSHPWAERTTPLTAIELARTPLVTREAGSGSRLSLEQLLSEAGIERSEIAPPRMSLSTNAAVRTAIVSGIAPGALSSLAIADDISLGRLVEVPMEGFILRRALSAIWQGGTQPRHDAARALIAIARTAG